MAREGIDGNSLKIVHVLRAPLGGLFRHVLDITREQIARGHQVGMITDSLAGGEHASKVLAELEPQLALGLMRLPIPRNPNLSDIGNLLAIRKRCMELQPDVIHGHGSKGGLFARLPGFLPGAGHAIRVYTPHGGSFNYRPGTFLHRLYMFVEGILERRTDLFLFESDFIRSCFVKYVGEPHHLSKVVLNGISDAEFEPVQPDADAADFLYVGELRSAKGIDTFIDALAELKNRTGVEYHAVLVGTGPDQQALTQQANDRGVGGQISFPGAMAARTAFRLGRAMVVPSRAESLPYVVLEAAGARVPLISTNVGGIPEIFGPFRDRLINCNDKTVLADALQKVVAQSPEERANEAEQLGRFVESTFHVSDMADAALDGYREALGLPLAAPKPDYASAAQVADKDFETSGARTAGLV
ncbi:MAG: glycosyltransferase [Hyphomicrobiales bacterium]|nr:glycosyltransferase [Hyphomicrobiales bacterium]